jgi:hypothetical protein
MLVIVTESNGQMNELLVNVEILYIYTSVQYRDNDLKAKNVLRMNIFAHYA